MYARSSHVRCLVSGGDARSTARSEQAGAYVAGLLISGSLSYGVDVEVVFFVGVEEGPVGAAPPLRSARASPSLIRAAFSLGVGWGVCRMRSSVVNRCRLAHSYLLRLVLSGPLRVSTTRTHTLQVGHFIGFFSTGRATQLLQLVR